MTSFDKSFIKAFTDQSHTTAPVGQDGFTARLPAAAPHITAPAATWRDSRPVEMDIHVDDAHSARRDASETRPLSSYTPRPKVHDSWRAMLEVDRFPWPATCEELLVRLRPHWDRFADTIIEALAGGHKCLGVSSLHRNVGRTTTLLALSRLLASRGMRPVLVDADCTRPELGEACGVVVQTGWDDLLASELALGESLIAAVEDGVTLLPWRTAVTSGAVLPTSLKAGGIFGTLREHYDLVLVDLPPLGTKPSVAEMAAFATTIHLDRLYLVDDLRDHDRDTLTSACNKLNRAGLSVTGIIENFAAGPDHPRGTTSWHGRRTATVG
jgi:Mrp family chromosome partitioning ATPase